MSNLSNEVVDILLAETSPIILAGAHDFDPSMIGAYPRRVKGEPLADLTANKLAMRLKVGKRTKTDKEAMSQLHGVLQRGTTGDYVERLRKTIPSFSGYKDWYEHSRDAVDRHFKTPVTHYGKFVSGLLAATSPQLNTGQNLRRALQAADNIIMGNKLSGMDSHLGNVIRSSTGSNLSGQKVFSFDKNLSGDEDYTTVDSHEVAGQLNRFVGAVTPDWYKPAVMANRDLADRTGWTNAQTQAAVWAFDIARTGGNHPSFHRKDSPFHHYSELAGGHLPVITGNEPPEHSYAEYLDHPDNAPIIKQFTDRWDAKIQSDPTEHARVNGGEYTPSAIIRGTELSKSDLKDPGLIKTLIGPKSQVLPDQLITNPYGDKITQTANRFAPELHKAIKAQRLTQSVEYTNLVNSLVEDILETNANDTLHDIYHANIARDFNRSLELKKQATGGKVDPEFEAELRATAGHAHAL
jgi:hypothetical protein